MKKSTISVLALCLAFSNLSAQTHQNEYDFNANWQFARYGLQADGSRKDEPAAVETPGFNDKEWRTLDLPHDWAIEGPFRQELDGYTGKLPWRGIGWYRKHFTVSDKDKDNCFYLDFDGAMANAEVWLNGEKVGGWPYGYTSFRVNLTPFLQYNKENIVAVRLNTEKWGSRWYPGAGIYRNVRLVKTHPLHVGHWGTFVTTPIVTPQKAQAKVEVKIENNCKVRVSARYNVDIYELNNEDKIGKKVASSETRVTDLLALGQWTDSVKIDIPSPKLWSIEHTHRYMARVYVYNGKKQTDVYDTPFGIRTIQFTHDNGFLLNGKRVQIKGTCNHHDLGALGAAMNKSALERQLRILKSFGCNALRTSHNPPAPELLELADKMGFVVMDETFDTWQHNKKENDYASLYKEWHEKDIEALVCRDRNHPSVIIWSTGNEVAEQYYPQTGTARHLTEIVHRLDPTRPASFGASFPSRSAMNGTELQVDVHGMNYATGVYGGPNFYGDFLNKPGHEDISGYSSESASTISSRGEYFPRNYHVTSYDTKEPGWGGLPDWEFSALERYPGICGEFVWTGFDYIGEPTPFNSDMSVLLNDAAALSAEELEKKKAELTKMEKNRPTSRSSYFGIVDIAGFPKDRYYLYQSHWMPEKPMVHILPHWNFPDRIGQVTPVYVYTSGDEAELFLNGKSLGKKKKGQYEYRLKWEDVVYTPGELKAVAYKNGQKWAETQVCTTGEAVQLKLTPEKSTIKADGKDLLFIRVSFVDKEGREVPTAEHVITSSVEGKGKVVATDNGDPTCLITFSNPTRPAFNGLYLAIVKAEAGQKGTLVYKAEAKGLGEAEVKIKIIK